MESPSGPSGNGMPVVTGQLAAGTSCGLRTMSMPNEPSMPSLSVWSTRRWILGRSTGMMGEVVGMAAAVCQRHDALPREVCAQHFDELAGMMRLDAGKSR